MRLLLVWLSWPSCERWIRGWRPYGQVRPKDVTQAIQRNEANLVHDVVSIDVTLVQNYANELRRDIDIDAFQLTSLELGPLVAIQGEVTQPFEVH